MNLKSSKVRLHLKGNGSSGDVFLIWFCRYKGQRLKQQLGVKINLTLGFCVSG